MVREGYKQSEVGVIPEDWEETDLSDIVEVIDGDRGTNYPGDGDFSPDGYCLFLSARNVTKDGFRFSECSFITEAKDRLLRKGKLSRKDVVLTTRGTVGNFAFFDDSIPYEAIRINSGMVLLRNKSEDLEHRFFYMILKSYLIQNQIERAVFGSAQPQLTVKGISEFRIPLPPIKEQRSIAQALSDIDGLIAALDKMIGKKRVIKTATMQQLLTCKKRLSGFGEGKGYKESAISLIPEDWEVRRLETVSSMSGRIGWQGLKYEEFTFNDIDPFLITGMNFKDGKIRWEEVYHIPEKRYQEAKNIQLEDGDILMTKDGTIGKLLYVEDIPFPRKASLNSHLLVFRPLNHSYDPKFLFYQLSSKQFSDYVELNKSGSTFFGITQQAVENYNAYLPSLEEQRAIASILSDMDAEIAALESRLAKTQAIKQGMMQELLTGKTRLV